MEEMNQLKVAIARCLDTMFGGLLPDGQPSGTALAAALTLELAPADATSRVLYGAPKMAANKIVKDLLAAHTIAFEPREWIVDFVVMDRRSSTLHIPLVACESEMHSDHGTGYGFETCEYGGKKCLENGYVWDFCKLLHFPAPRLLFTARLPDSKMLALENSLRECAREYCDLWSARCLNAVLFPSGKTRRRLVRIGQASTDGTLCFENL
jgi:hypothetical protein